MTDKVRITRAISRPLKPVDRCDRCGSAARTRVVLVSGLELLLCGHHTNQHLPALGAVGATVTYD